MKPWSSSFHCAGGCRFDQARKKALSKVVWKSFVQKYVLNYFFERGPKAVDFGGARSIAPFFKAQGELERPADSTSSRHVVANEKNMAA